MNEVQRMQYLSALDVDCYMPRFILPNAPAITQCALPAVAATVKTCADAAINDETITEREKPRSQAFVPSADAMKAASDVLASLGVESVPKAPDVKPVLPVADPEPAVNTGSLVEVQPFSLSLQQLGRLLIIDSRNTDTPLPTDRLLANMTLALGYAPQDMARAEILNWPFSGGNSADNSESARADLQAFLDGRLLNSNVKTLLLLGSVAAEYILPADKNYGDSLYSSMTLPEFSVDAIIAPSLYELLQEPALKQSLWGVLRDSKVQPL